MSKDKSGKEVKVGHIVKDEEGRKLRVVGVLTTDIIFVHAGKSEVVDAFVGGKDSGDEGDTIIWGT